MSLLTSLTESRVESEPFPHLVVENVLAPDFCRILVREFPSLVTFTRGGDSSPNRKIVRRNTELLADDTLSPVWREWIEAHLDPALLGQWMGLFGESLAVENPQLALELANLPLAAIGFRGEQEGADRDVFLDAALVAHTPTGGSVCQERGPHLKEADKPFLGFLYLRSEEDEAEGADLELYAPRSGVHPRCGARHQFDPADLEIVKRIPYRSNTLFLMLNTPRSITTHAPRWPAETPMHYFHFLAALPHRMFSPPTSI